MRHLPVGATSKPPASPRVRQPQLDSRQLLDLVAHPRGLLELEIAGVLEHLLLRAS